MDIATKKWMFNGCRELEKKINEEDRKKLLKLFGYKDKGINLMIKAKASLIVALSIALLHFDLKKEGIGAFLDRSKK